MPTVIRSNVTSYLFSTFSSNFITNTSKINSFKITKDANATTNIIAIFIIFGFISIVKITWNLDFLYGECESTYIGDFSLIHSRKHSINFSSIFSSKFIFFSSNIINNKQIKFCSTNNTINSRNSIKININSNIISIIYTTLDIISTKTSIISFNYTSFFTNVYNMRTCFITVNNNYNFNIRIFSNTFTYNCGTNFCIIFFHSIKIVRSISMKIFYPLSSNIIIIIIRKSFHN